MNHLIIIISLSIIYILRYFLTTPKIFIKLQKKHNIYTNLGDILNPKWLLYISIISGGLLISLMTGIYVYLCIRYKFNNNIKLIIIYNGIIGYIVCIIDQIKRYKKHINKQGD